MSNFKELKWYPQQIGKLNGLYAEHEGLKWRYSILVHKNERIEFALLDSYYEYAPGFPVQCSSIAEAQAKAANHYELLLKQLII